MEWGCIPIVRYGDAKDVYQVVYGDHPFEVVKRWEDAPERIRSVVDQPSRLKKRMDLVRHWYVGFKHRLAVAFSRLNTCG